ncbi:MAG: SIMPL domain-containing protein [Armatimonadota bacterium]|nr:SIMPL domain-containing protein [Armatimonadota bacterium]
MRWVLVVLLMLSLTMLPAGAQAPEPGRHQIVTTGHGRIEVSPDQASVSVGGQAQRATAAEAAAEVNRTATQALERIRGLGIRADAIRTSAVQVFPIYSTPRDGSAPQITGYRATSMLTVTVADLSLVGRVIDASIQAGANLVHGISFGLRDASRARNEALTLAVRDARDKGEAIAQAAGLRISGIERIVEEGASVQPREMRVAAAPVPTPVEPGTVSVTAQVTVVFRY